jgi:hypothetical protein
MPCLLFLSQLVAFAHDIVDDDEDFDEHLPFMAIEPRSKQKKSRRGGQRRKVNEEDALEALYGLRNELEVGQHTGSVFWMPSCRSRCQLGTITCSQLMCGLQATDSRSMTVLKSYGRF